MSSVWSGIEGSYELLSQLWDFFKSVSYTHLSIEAAFDVDKAKVGTKVNDIEIFHIDQFRAMAAERNVVIGIITV